MNRFMLASPILLLFISVSAFADSVTIILAPGSPDESNFQFVSHQQGTSVFLVGTVPESFYSTSLIAPGSTFGRSVPSICGWRRHQDQWCLLYDNLGLDIGSLFISSFTFPTNGNDFTVPIQASFSVDEEIVGTGINIRINETVSGKVTFHFISNVGLYRPSKNSLKSTVPEPATLGLVGTGLRWHIRFCAKRNSSAFTTFRWRRGWGFEPTIPVKVCPLSRRIVSTAHAPLRVGLLAKFTIAR